MFLVGNVSAEAQELCRITKHSLDEAIKICGPGVPIREVGKVSWSSGARNPCSLIIGEHLLCSHAWWTQLVVHWGLSVHGSCLAFTWPFI